MRRHDWSGFASLGAAVLSIVALGRGASLWALGWLVVALLAAALTRYWSVAYPAPMPHRLRCTLLVPRGNHAPEHLKRILAPRNGERILEVGPGIGIHAVAVAQSLAPDGALDVIDVQREMLDDVRRRAGEAGLGNITAQRGDAQQLPYRDATFDGVYLIGVLGEIPDGHAALREMRRVLKSTGRLVIGEVFFDPDCVFLGSLKGRAEAASLAFEHRVGGSLSYLARFRPM
jgi:SAM-dependent methyltransferase